MTDLREYKRALEEAAAAFSPERAMAYQMQVKQKFSEAMFVFMAWIFAAALPFISTSVNRPTGSDAMKVYSFLTILVGFSCYLGTRARRQGSRRGYVLKLMVPLLLRAMRTALKIVLAVIFCGLAGGGLMIAARRAGYNADGLVLGLVIGAATGLGIYIYESAKKKS